MFTTASPKHLEYVIGLGAGQAFEYRSPTVVQDIIFALKHKNLAGALAIGNKGAESCMAVLEKCQGSRFIALANFPMPESFPEDFGPNLAISSPILSVLWWQVTMWVKSQVKGIPTKYIIGDTLQHNEVIHVVYEDSLPQALAEGIYVAAPERIVVDHGSGGA